MWTFSYLGEGEIRNKNVESGQEGYNYLEEKFGYLCVGLVLAHFEVLSKVLVFSCLVNLRLKLEEKVDKNMFQRMS